MNLINFRKRLVFSSTYLIPFSILAAKGLEIVLRRLNIYVATTEESYIFLINFIEWFGVLYGILLPLILLFAWQRLDSIDREFDKEVSAVKLLHEDIHYLYGHYASIGAKMTALLRTYVVHVINNYVYEINGSDSARLAGDKILQEIRDLYRILISHEGVSREMETIILFMHDKITGIVKVRGDRIALASQRLFGSLRAVALITSILFIIPFYFVGLNSGSDILVNFLIIGVTLLVIFIYQVIEDLDEPFSGVWKITDESWRRILNEMDSAEYKLELEYKSKHLSKKVRPTKRRMVDKK